MNRQGTYQKISDDSLNAIEEEITERWYKSKLVNRIIKGIGIGTIILGFGLGIKECPKGDYNIGSKTDYFCRK